MLTSPTGKYLLGVATKGLCYVPAAGASAADQRHPTVNAKLPAHSPTQESRDVVIQLQQ